VVGWGGGGGFWWVCVLVLVVGKSPDVEVKVGSPGGTQRRKTGLESSRKERVRKGRSGEKLILQRVSRGFP